MYLTQVASVILKNGVGQLSRSPYPILQLGKIFYVEKGTILPTLLHQHSVIRTKQPSSSPTTLSSLVPLNSPTSGIPQQTSQQGCQGPRLQVSAGLMEESTAAVALSVHDLGH